MPDFTTSDGLRLAYRDDGEGPALLCLAGLTRSSADFESLVRALPHRRLIRLDYRGRGASEWDRHYKNYNAMIEARDVVEFLDHLEIESAPILGTSRGGIVSMAIATTWKSRLSAVIFNDIGPDIEESGLKRIADYLGRQPEAASIEEAAANMAEGAVGFANVPMERWMQECRNRYRFENGRPLLNYDPMLRDAVLDSLVGQPLNLWPLFEALHGVPIALIKGAGSDLLSAATVGKMLAVRPDMELLEVADRGHCPFLDEPECVEFIDGFLARTERSAGGR